MDQQQARFLMSQLADLWASEFPATCKVLGAVPEGARDYRPDEKSRTAWDLTVHLASSDLWFLDAVRQGAFSWSPDGETTFTAQCPTVAAVVETYKTQFPEKLDAVRAMAGDDLSKVVDFFGLFQKPNVSFLGFGNNHSIHHRGQLASYLRAMGSKVPAIYGGSADEPMQQAT